jgi:DNA-binding protein HU-beta
LLGGDVLTRQPLGSKIHGESRQHFSTLAQGVDPVNRNELVDAVAGKTELRKTEASKAVDAVFDVIADVLKGGDEVRLVGFGTFSVASRAASEGRNPRTGEKIKIAASKQAKFKPGKGLRDSLN